MLPHEEYGAAGTERDRKVAVYAAFRACGGSRRGIIYEEISALGRTVETLHPGYFDIVMATGIVAIAAHVERIWLAPLLLTYLNIVLGVVLLAMNALRLVWCLVWYPAAFRRDLSDFERGPGLFTLVAGAAPQCSKILGRIFETEYQRSI